MILLWLWSGCATAATVGSIGAVLSRDPATGAVHIREAPEGLAAASGGLLPGDRLKMVDGQLLDELERQAIKDLLRGPVGTSVALTILRGEEVIHRSLIRQPLSEASTLQATEERID